MGSAAGGPPAAERGPGRAAGVRLPASGPGVQRLLREAAWYAEQWLHLCRGVLLLALFVIFLVVWDGARQLPLPLVLGSVVVASGAWGGVAWLLFRGRHRGWLPYLLIVLDALLLVRLAVSVRLQAFEWVDAYDLVSAADLSAAVPPLFVLLALSGAFRFDIRLALLTTVLATAGMAVSALSLELSPRTAVPQLIVVGVAGLLGVRAAQHRRHVELKAQEEAILESYVPEALVEELVFAEDPAHHTGKVMPVTLLITDIRGFTTLSESFGPMETVALLNEYFSAVLGPLTEEGGYLDKYLGDGLLAFFESADRRFGPDHSARGLRAAQGILAAIEAYNASRPDRPPLRIGIAVHSGDALVGSVGAPGRLNYTAIGDAVNVTARLEELNKQFHSVLVASAPVVQAAGDAAPAGLVGPVSVELRGRHAVLDVHYLPASAQPSAISRPEAGEGTAAPGKPTTGS